MAGFQKFLQRTSQNATRFFNSTLPTRVSQGIRFFNSSVVPAAKRIHNVHSVISKELQTNPNVAPKVREVATKSSAFADLGLKKLGQAEEAITRVGSQLGLT